MPKELATVVSAWGLVSFILVCGFYVSELNDHIMFPLNIVILQKHVMYAFLKEFFALFSVSHD